MLRLHKFVNIILIQSTAPNVRSPVSVLVTERAILIILRVGAETAAETTVGVIDNSAISVEVAAEAANARKFKVDNAA